jgi:hypothetical protein
VKQRVRHGHAILITTTEGNFGVWVITRPNKFVAPRSHPYDEAKLACAEAGRTSWVHLEYNDEKGIHEWEIIPPEDVPNAILVWPDEHPLVVIDRAIQTIFVDDPNFPDFQNLDTIDRAKRAAQARRSRAR